MASAPLPPDASITAPLDGFAERQVLAAKKAMLLARVQELAEGVCLSQMLQAELASGDAGETVRAALGPVGPSVAVRGRLWTGWECGLR